MTRIFSNAAASIDHMLEVVTGNRAPGTPNGDWQRRNWLRQNQRAVALFGFVLLPELMVAQAIGMPTPAPTPTPTSLISGVPPSIFGQVVLLVSAGVTVGLGLLYRAIVGQRRRFERIESVAGEVKEQVVPHRPDVAMTDRLKELSEKFDALISQQQKNAEEIAHLKGIEEGRRGTR